MKFLQSRLVKQPAFIRINAELLRAIEFTPIVTERSLMGRNQ